MLRWKATVAAAALCAFATAPALSQGAPSTGFAEFVARINSGATVARGSGVVSVASSKPGVYVVTFSRDVFGCYSFVSVAGDSGFATTELSPNRPVEIKVSTFNKTGSAAKRNFNILVRCQD